jgi:hypothetical protein
MSTQDDAVPWARKSFAMAWTLRSAAPCTSYAMAWTLRSAAPCTVQKLSEAELIAQRVLALVRTSGLVLRTAFNIVPDMTVTGRFDHNYTHWATVCIVYGMLENDMDVVVWQNHGDDSFTVQYTVPRTGVVNTLCLGIEEIPRRRNVCNICCYMHVCTPTHAPILTSREAERKLALCLLAPANNPLLSKIVSEPSLARKLFVQRRPVPTLEYLHHAEDPFYELSLWATDSLDVSDQEESDQEESDQEGTDEEPPFHSEHSGPEPDW